MDPRVLGAFAANHGLLTRAAVLDLGLSPDEIKRLVRQKHWVAVRRGVYTTAEVWNSLDEHRDRPRLVARAVVMTMKRGWLLSHTSAAAELGLAVLRPPRPVTHITRPGWTNAWTENEVAHHLARFDESQVLAVDGLRMLDVPRTAVDIAREYGVRHGLVACDSALRMGCAREDLVAAYAIMDNWPGVTGARTAVSLADPGAETPIESLGRELVLEAGIGTPETQFPVRLARGVVWCDMRVGNHIIETDGRIKLRSIENGGVAVDIEQALWDEKLRERYLTARGLVVSRLVWDDHYGRRRAEAIRRLQVDHEDSVRRFGAVLAPQLAAEAEQIRREYGDRKPA